MSHDVIKFVRYLPKAVKRKGRIIQMKAQLIISSCIVSIFLVTGCVTETVLTMQREKPVLDKSAVSNQIRSRKYSKLIVISPSGAKKDAYESRISLFERELLKKGITVISGAITGKVVLEPLGTVDEKKSETAAQLSDLERALIMAKRTGAEGVLQIGTFESSTTCDKTRFFLTPTPQTPFREVDQAEYYALTGYKYVFSSTVVRFVGRFIDVESGEVLASFDVSLPINYSLPNDYVAAFKLCPDYVVKETIRENYPYSDREAGDLMERMSEDRIVKSVVSHIFSE